MIKLTKIYTRGGDKGKTSLGNGQRVGKTHPRIEAIGAVDEANAALGLARMHADSKAAALLAIIQNDLFDLGADLCMPEKQSKKKPLRITAHQVEHLEHAIDGMNETLAPLNSFILPGGSHASSYLHLARTIVRRAERRLIALSGRKDAWVNPEAVKYLNRLSDFLFVMARFLNDKGKGDVLWEPGKNL